MGAFRLCKDLKLQPMTAAERQRSICWQTAPIRSAAIYEARQPEDGEAQCPSLRFDELFTLQKHCALLIR